MNVDEIKSKIGSVNPFKFLQWGIAIILTAIIFKLLREFNLIGTSKETKEAAKLGTDETFKDTVTNQMSDNKSKFREAIKKKFGLKPTKKQLDSLLPNFDNIPKWVVQLEYDIHHWYKSNDADKVFNMYKQLRSQYEVNFFNSTYSAKFNKDAYKTIDNLLKDSDMMKLREMINSKPVI